jgi:hypothetical protein
MDDGSLKYLNKSNAMRICTDSFSEGGVKLLQEALKDLYNIETVLGPIKKNSVIVGYRIAIPEESSAAFRD